MARLKREEIFIWEHLNQTDYDVNIPFSLWLYTSYQLFEKCIIVKLNPHDIRQIQQVWGACNHIIFQPTLFNSLLHLL